MLSLGPVLAQLATLSLGDRSEVRYIAPEDKHYEATTRPFVALGLRTRQLTLAAGYSPSITVIPLEDNATREVLLFHTLYLAVTRTWGRTWLTVSENAGLGEQNFRTVGLTDTRFPQTPTGAPPTSAPPTTTPPAGMPPTNTPPTGTPPTGQPTQGTNPVRAYGNEPIAYVNSTTTIGLTHQATAAISYYEEVSYLVSGSTRDEDRALYPLIKGPRFLTTLRYRTSRVDEFVATAMAQYAASSLGTSVWIGTGTGTWVHKLSPTTATQLGAGLGFSRTPLYLGFVMYSIYPVLNASITDTSRLGRGKLGTSVGVSSAPVVDITTGAADPRLGFYSLINWKRDRFTALLTADSSVSIAQSTSDSGALAATRGSLTAASGSAGVSYGLTKTFSVDTGIRVTYQSYRDRVTIPLNYAAFVGFSFGLQQQL
ncbi:MAG TPA: hypothetical protein VER12_01120 [Polyangiaceae bacterium]|nr:hypothetical protein [Polyangiaceae bacterium]